MARVFLEKQEAEAQKQAALAEMRDEVDQRFDKAVNEAVERALAARDREDAAKGKTEKTAEELAFEAELAAEEKAKAEAAKTGKPVETAKPKK